MDKYGQYSFSWVSDISELEGDNETVSDREPKKPEDTNDSKRTENDT